MLKKTDEYIKNRLIWKAKQYSLSSEFVIFHDDLSLELATSLSKHINTGLSGIPVLLFTNPDKAWTLLCTRQVIGFDNHHIYSVHFNEIECVISKKLQELSGIERPLSMNEIEKDEWTKLLVKTKEGKDFLFHANKGSDFFALWNIVLMVSGFRFGDL